MKSPDHRLRALAAPLLCLSLAACAVEPAPPDGPAVYVGHVTGSDALVAVLASRGALVAYTCGGATTWSSQTGWFHPVTGAATEGGVIPATRSPTGMELRGSYDPARATGTLRLSDGRTLAWSADRAAGPAGLFTRMDASGSAGLIVANDGAMAGVSARSDGDGGRASSAIAAALPSVGASRVTGGTTTTTGVRVDVDLVRTDRPAALQTTPDGPVIVVLLHGVTSRLDEIDPLTGRRAPDPDLAAIPGNPAGILQPLPGSRLHARRFWSSPFVSGLLSGRRDGPLFTLGASARDVSGDRFLLASTALDIDADEAGGRVDPAACDLDDFIVAERPAAAQSPLPGARPLPPRRAVLLTHRDGKLDFTRQLSHAADQIYACVSLYERTYGVKPGLVFVGHSGGGLVSRGIFSNPPRAAFVAARAPGLAPGENRRYDQRVVDGVERDSVRDEMAFLRDRALYAVTLASPHEGSDFADRAATMRERIEPIRQWLAAGANADFPDFGLDVPTLAFVRSAASALALPRPPTAVERAEDTTRRVSELLRDALGYVLALYDDAPMQAQLTRSFWRAMNLGPLDPNAARRGAGSPIPGAGGALIPVYAAGARSAGADVFDTLDVRALTRDLAAYDRHQTPEKARFWVAITLLTDGLLRLTDGVPRPPPQLATRLDRVRVVRWEDEVRRMLADYSAPLDAAFQATYAVAGGTARDAMVAWLSNETGTRLNQLSLVPPLYLPRVWRIEDGPVSLPAPALRCVVNVQPSVPPIPLTLYPAAITALVRAHGSIDGAIRAVASLNPEALMAQIAADGVSASTAAAGLAAALAERLAALHAPCVDPLNWRLGVIQQTAFLPLPKETDDEARDGFVDHDGFVTYDSALAVTLGRDGVGGAPRTLEFFDHTRRDARAGATPVPGSWYRRYSSALEPFNHEIQRFEVAVWVRSILDHNAGPLPAIDGDFSVYPQP